MIRYQLLKRHLVTSCVAPKAFDVHSLIRQSQETRERSENRSGFSSDDRNIPSYKRSDTPNRFSERDNSTPRPDRNGAPNRFASAERRDGVSETSNRFAERDTTFKRTDRSETNRFRNPPSTSEYTRRETPNRSASPSTYQRTERRTETHNRPRDPKTERRTTPNRFVERERTFPERRHRHEREPIRRPLKFEFNTGSDQAKDAVKHLILAVKEHSPKFHVNVLDPNTNQIQRKHLANVVNSTSLDDSGLSVVINPDPAILPLIKHVSLKEMLKKYGDQLAKQREEELLEAGSRIVLRVINQREKAARKRSAPKVVNLKWNISIYDLSNQKKAEIIKKLDRGDIFHIVISPHRKAVGAAEIMSGVMATEQLEETETRRLRTIQFEDQEIDIEWRKREAIVTKVQEILEEKYCAYETSGNLESSMIIKCVPKLSNSEQVEAQEKQIKTKEKPKEKKQQKKKKIDEDELDSLYLLKIED